MSQVCFESISQQKQNDFDQINRVRNRMNLLGKSHRNMTTYLFKGLAKPFLVSSFPDLIGTLTSAFSLNPQFNLSLRPPVTISIQLFLLIVAIARVAKQHFVPADLWAIVKAQVDDLETGCIIVDDSIKPKDICFSLN